MFLSRKSRRAFAPWLLSIPFCTALLVATPDAAAQSRRTQAAIEALEQRMTDAEARYREALVKAGNNDPTGVDEGNAALEDMEDVIVECGQLRGCGTGNLLATYRRLLKTRIDGAAAVDPEDVDATLMDDGDLPTGDVPASASAASLLADRDRRFVELVKMNPAVQAGIRRW